MENAGLLRVIVVGFDGFGMENWSLGTCTIDGVLYLCMIPTWHPWGYPNGFSFVGHYAINGNDPNALVVRPYMNENYTLAPYPGMPENVTPIDPVNYKRKIAATRINLVGTVSIDVLEKKGDIPMFGE